VVKLVAAEAGGEVRLRVRDQYTVTVVPAFKCSGIWPRSAAQWPAVREWPAAAALADVKAEGFHLLSRESPETRERQQQQQQPMQQQQSSSEGGQTLLFLASFFSTFFVRFRTILLMCFSVCCIYIN
jgi:hypothetical protein